MQIDEKTNTWSIYKRLADVIDPFSRADGPPPNKLWPFIGWAIKGAEKYLYLTLIASAIVGISQMSAFNLIGWLIDQSQTYGADYLADHWVTMTLICLFFIIVWPASLVLHSSMNQLVVTANLYPLSLTRIQRHTLGQALTFFDNDFAGRIAQKAQQTARAITDVISEGINIAGSALSAALSAVFLMALVDWRLMLITAAWILSYVVVIQHYVPKIRSRSQLRAARRAVVTGQIVDTITNISTVKLFAHGQAEEVNTEEALDDFRDAGIGWAGTVSNFRMVIFMLAGLLPALLLTTTLWLWSQGMATAGDIAVAGLASTRLANMTGWVSFAALGIFTNIGEIEDGIQTLSPGHTILDPDAPKDLQKSTGAVHFHDLTFRYGGKKTALNGFDLDIKAGEKVALVGRSGAGKSTITSLLLRLYDVEDGQVLLDGQDIRSMSQDGLRRQVAMVTQDTAMFNRSAFENIRYGTPNATEEQVFDAARKAEAHEFILGLSDHRGRRGYEAHLGERGVKLSGGQRQRVALARAILKDAPILVLDEATSALDSEVEAQIQTALERVMEGKTVLAIAHRLSTISQMDRIVVMEQGAIAEQGNHSELLAKHGTYANFWARQSGGFLDADAAE